MTDEKTNKNKLIPLFMIISGIIILILGITMVQTGFAGLDNIEPTIGLYIGGIFTIIGGSLLLIAGIITFFFDDLKKKYIRMLSNIADAVEEDRRKNKEENKKYDNNILFCDTTKTSVVNKIINSWCL